jgi:short-subunit dehydrogenase
MQLRNKVCVVTGASSGIGRRTALDLAAAGAIVCAAARREERLQTLTAECHGQGHSYVVTDVSDRDQVKDLAEHVRRTHGRCDVLVNNAGFSGDHLPLGHPGAVAEIEGIMATNFFGAVSCTAELLSLIEESVPSTIVNVGSMAGRIPVGGSSTYTASKFALVGWSEALRYELSARDICVSLVLPGLIPTEGFPQTDLAADPLLRRILGTEDQVADSILDTIVRGRAERTVPRWYYLVQAPRLVVPPLYRYALRKVSAKYARHRPLV